MRAPACGAPRTAFAPAHFGELLQGRLGPDGPVALVTLPWPGRGVRAVWRPGPQPFGVWPPEPLVARLWRALGAVPRGRLCLRRDMPLGAGAGASTATLVAAARAAGLDDPAALAAACRAVEGAVDPLMWPAPERRLWASRRAETLALLPALPALEVLGGFVGPGRRTDPADQRFPDVADLVAAWPSACADAGALAALAAAAARRTLALRGPQDDPSEALARRLGAAGFAIAHTGSARALLFRPGTVPPGAAAQLAEAGFRGVTRFRLGGEGR